MSKISDIVDGLGDMLAAAFPHKKRFPNAYDIPSNNQLYLADGYGIAVGPGARQDLEVGCNIYYERAFAISITKEIAATAHDTDKKVSIDKEILEEFNTLRLALEKDLTLGGKCIDIEYTADSGLQFTSEEEQRYMIISLTVVAQYREALT